MRFRDNNYFYHKAGGHETIFEAANQDCTNAQYQYFGFLNADGGWVIQRFDIQSAAIQYEYAAGQSVIDYLINWDATGAYTGSLTFKRFDQIKFG